MSARLWLSNCHRMILVRSACSMYGRGSKARNLRMCFSTSPSSGKQSFLRKYDKHIIIGTTVASAVLIYSYMSGRKDEKIDIDSKVIEELPEVKFVEERLDEKLNLLEKFGAVPYLIIGGGTAAVAAFRAIRAKDPEAKVLIVTEEPFYPYMRPPLSKEMWYDEDPNVAETLTFKQWNGRVRDIYFEHADFYAPVDVILDNIGGGVSVIRGLSVVRIDPTDQVVYFDNGKSLAYQKCLLATGGKPKNLPVIKNATEDIKKHVTLFRGINDFKKIHKISKRAKSITIIGGGFLGSELACGLGKRGQRSGMEVIQLFPEEGNLGKVLPKYLSKWTVDKICNEGVKVIPEVTIKEITTDGKRITLHLSNDEQVTTDHAIVAVGLEPNTRFAHASGLEIDEKHGGFLVNTELEARKNLWVAGDVSCFYDTKLGRRRVEHHDHAVVSGRLAGENMTGSGKPYWHQSMFWSDLGPEVGFEAIGIIDSSLQTMGIFAKATESDTPKAVVETTGEGIRSDVIEIEPTETEFQASIPRPPLPGDNFGKGIVFYLRDNLIVGVLLWNVFKKIPIARKIINEGKPFDDLVEVAKHFELHLSEEEEG